MNVFSVTPIEMLPSCGDPGRVLPDDPHARPEPFHRAGRGRRMPTDLRTLSMICATTLVLGPGALTAFCSWFLTDRPLTPEWPRPLMAPSAD